MYKANEFFNSHEKHEAERMEVVPRMLVDKIEDFDHVFKLYIDSKDNKKSPQEIYELRHEFENNLNEFTHYLAERAPIDTLLEPEYKSFLVLADSVKKKIENLLNKDELSETDVLEWDDLQIDFCDKIESVRKLLTREEKDVLSKRLTDEEDKEGRFPPPSLN